MNLFWLCITSVLSVTSALSNPNIDLSHIRVFPGANQSFAGVLQVSYINDLNQPQYAFNASEARRLCLSLRLDIASKAQVKKALTRGLETCRFGWIDEHFAVIPRIHALANCGQNQTGLVPWRASVTQKFDVFCFNESDAAAQLKDATTDSPLSTRHYSGLTSSKATSSTPSAKSTSSSSSMPSSSSSPESIDNEVEPAHFVGSAQGPARGKVVLIICTCALLVAGVFLLAYFKLCHSEVKQQQEYIQTEEWTCVVNIKETKQAVQDDERIDGGDSEH
ncbi:lymphatic vessel endothelial hyaluronic acid receptor 1a isoform X2 [Parambassis ranga]|uniref:Lymphatic vessel endothelial hyaluronic acid receptor 1a isoform X2 n=1 Tax=Parambassis ranga TaxID=210632 RepID=A0A6P7HNT7_9TELE|nr:lymphatic vessel endothelial hyaluronic acid receptor 1 isoform X2 [Parambassis ranga]